MAQSNSRFFILCIPFIISACTLERETTQIKKTGKLEQVLRFGNGSEPEDLDPGIVIGTVEGNIVENLFEGLTIPDLLTGLPKSGIALSWDPNENATQFTFHLRKDARWSNGDKLTAHDFVYSWQRVLDPRTISEYAYLLFFIKNGQAYHNGEIKNSDVVGVHALDDYTLVVDLEKPTPYFDQLTSFYTYFPVHKATVERYGKNWTKPEHIISNGAFVLDTWRHQEVIILKKNPHYWDAQDVKLDRIEFFPIENTDTEHKLFMSGELDYAHEVQDIKIPFLRKKPFFHSDPWLGVYFYRLNVTRKPLDNPKIRLALKLAIDREKITSYIKKSGERPAFSLVTSGIHGYTSPEILEYNVDKARKLLAEAGYPDGKGFPILELLYNTLLDHQRIALAIQDMWKKNLGIDVRLFNQEWKVYLDSQKTLNYDICRGGWIGDYVEPSTFLELFTTRSGLNQTGWSDPNYDALIERAASVVNADERYKIYREAEELILQEGPVLPIYFYTRNYLLAQKVKGFLPNLLDKHLLKYVYIED